MGNRFDVQQIFPNGAPKKDDKKPEGGKVFRETLETLAALLFGFLAVVGACAILQALCRCR